MSIARHSPKSHISVRDEQHIKYFMVNNAIIDEWAARLSHATFKVYIALCRYARGSEASVSYKTMCARLDMSTASVARALQQLEGQRLIRVEHHKDERGVALNTYILLEVPVTSTSEATLPRDFTDESHPASTSEETPLQPVKCVLKTEESKDERKEGLSPTRLRLMEREQERRMRGKR